MKNKSDENKRLSKIRRIRETNNIFDGIEQLQASIYVPAMPFHHLIPAAFLTSEAAFTSSEESLPQFVNLKPSTANIQQLWQRVAGRGISAKEAALFDDSIECSFIELTADSFVGASLFQVDWEALHYNALEGGAELYLAEMFILKRRLYETGEQLPESIEFSIDEPNEYLQGTIFSSLVENISRLFFDSLSASYVLTVSQMDIDSGVNGAINSGISNKRKKPIFFSDLFESYLTESGSRTKGSSVILRKTEGKEIEIGIVNLADYWNHWQKAARTAEFDFDFLRTLNDARAIRFYELTKLLRVSPAQISGANIIHISERQAIPRHSSEKRIFTKLEIEYEKFTALMPLPRLSGEREIKHQINNLIKPLRVGGYVKSFALQFDEQGSGSRRARLVFRFND